MPKVTDFSADDLASLTEEELAGLKDTSLIDEGEDEVPADPSVAANAALETIRPAPPPAPAPAPGEIPTPANDNPPQPAPGVPANDNAPAPAVEPPASVPAPPADTPDFPTTIAGLKEQQNELARRFDDGELTAQEYQRLRSDIDDQVIEVRMQQHDHNRRAADALDVYNTETVPNWLAQHANEYPTGSPTFVALDFFVRQLQDEASRAGRNPYDPRILDQAHRQVSASFGRPVAPAPGLPVPANENHRQIPPALGQLPAAANDDVSGDHGRFAHIDRLDPIAQEQAMEAMTEAERAAYLRSAS